jgi:hypothetical protein
MHRSGTSAITRVVNLLGADVACDLLPAQSDNERGFWESPVVVDIHDRLLEALGSNWHDPFPLPKDWIEASATEYAKRDLVVEIKREFADSRLFVVKDPRITRLLPMWLEVLDELAIEPILVIPVRNPLEIGASLEARDRFPLAKSLLLYAHGCLETELASRPRRRIFVRYEQLLDDWRPFAVNLAKAAGSYTLLPGGERADEIDHFLTAELRHHRYSRADLAGTRDVAASVVEIFDRTSQASDSGDEKELRKSFDRLRETLAESSRLYRGVLAAERAKHEEELARFCQDRAVLRRLGAELGLARAQVTEWQSAAAARLAEVTRLQEELASAVARVVGAEETARLSTELAATSRRAVQSETAASALRAELDAIKQSSAWRLTRPLRLIGARLPWIRRRIRQVLKLIDWSATLQRNR